VGLIISTMSYNHQKTESKWQKVWQKNDLGQAKDFAKNKFYYLVEFPYPSADGLHVGHLRPYIAFDALARKKRMEGFNVLYPIGWDAFGLPTENYALKTGIHPAKATQQNIKNFKRQLQALGLSFDWSREVNTTDPKYYKWTQWIFSKLFERGLAYQAKMAINWCPSCKIGLANEEVVDGKCERCHTETERREIRQWMLRITKYADRLIDDLKTVNFLDKIKAQQINWIGKSYGTNIHLPVVGTSEVVKVFTTRVDTIFGVTAIILAPEHPLVASLLEIQNKSASWRTKIKNYEEAKKYIEQAKRKSDLERTDLSKTKTGVELKGVKVLNPINHQELPLWVGDYVIAAYGGGAVIMVAAHDERDFTFAQKYNLPIAEVVKSTGKDVERGSRRELLEAFCSDGVLINSGEFNGLTSQQAREKITEWLIKNNAGNEQINYKLRDWIFSRQHYWGEPIPLVYCEQCAKIKPKILLVHGIHGHSKENWFPWFKKEMESRGYEVLIPDLPNNEHPTLSEWLSALKKLDIKKNDRLFVVGHSLGAPTACQFILKNNLKVEKLILAAPTGEHMGPQNWQNLIKDGCDEQSIQCIKQFIAANKNLVKLNKLVTNGISVYFSTDDPYVPLTVQEDYKDLTATVKVLTNRGHFSDMAGSMREFPEILDDFPMDLNSGWVPLSEKDLPLELPKIDKYEPSGTGESPLAKITSWVNIKCPRCGGPGRRETDTMPNWAGSNWYYLAYLMQGINNFKFLRDMPFGLRGSAREDERTISNYKKVFNYWMPVDWYNGGMEHTTLHLLYSRFIYKFLYDIGVVPQSEPYQKRTSHGMVLAEDGQKMSKSFGNVINPDEIVEKYGADTLRLYEMFMGPFDEAISWSATSLVGCARFVNRIWEMSQSIAKENNHKNSDLEKLLHKTIKKVSQDMENLKFNTAISALMILVNAMEEQRQNLPRDIFVKFLIILSPFAPHLTEELWHNLIGASDNQSIGTQPWPQYDPRLIQDEEVELIVQINGKLRDKIMIQREMKENEIKALVLQSEKIKKHLGDRPVKKTIFVPGRLINLVV